MEQLGFEVVSIEKQQDVQLILGHAGFIKTIEDLYEVMVNTVPNAKFGIAFAEASGQCLVRSEGNDKALVGQAEKNVLGIGAGHTFLILFKGAYPINVLNAIKAINEVSRIYCATSNPVQVIIANTKQGRGIAGIVDGSASKGIEGKKDRSARKKLLRDLGYKLK
ncbi:MAG: adenosine-specific kinase [Candidatus Marsarchaeota archaeon]|jgi:adenosine/AMP kinase|nr:adenosine-specific kinase [Candidatus Marsarchaeota archaeon]MCL5418547.1 adenosine-specific kinase [Candidatus Marsarchaeota archaeon]